MAAQYAIEQQEEIHKKEEQHRKDEEKKEIDLLQSSTELLTEAEQKANLKAIKQVVAAKRLGEEKGATAAKEMIER